MTLTRIGTTTKGTDAYLDSRAATAWNAAAKLVKARLDIDLSTRILQALGSAEASAGVHEAPGVCVDIRVWNLTDSQILAVVALFRESGWAATWFRDWTGNRHIHAATDIDAPTPARYQITAVKAGYDGLGAAGKKGPDPHPKPTQWRTAATGAAWATQQLGEEMLTPEDKAWITAAINPWAATFGGPDKTAGAYLQRILKAAEQAAVTPWDATFGGPDKTAGAYLQRILKAAEQAASNSAVVDLAAVADQLTAAVADQLTDAVIAAIADAVVQHLGATITRP